METAFIKVLVEDKHVGKDHWAMCIGKMVLGTIGKNSHGYNCESDDKYYLNITHVLVGTPISEIIKQRLPSDEEIDKRYHNKDAAYNRAWTEGARESAKWLRKEIIKRSKGEDNKA